jgi:2-oxoisovalerate dehydrogenase E1 component alpha subunit
MSTIAARDLGVALPGGLSAADLLEMYGTMILSRVLDERIWMLNRQGKAAIAASAQGHEAAQIGTARALDPNKDHFLIYYRQLALLLALGSTPKELLAAFLARDGEPMSGSRQFPLHGAHPRVDLFSFSNVVATQLPQAVGVALADKMRRRDAVTIVFFGDGASSQGDTHEAMNFAGIHKLPVIFLCENRCRWTAWRAAHRPTASAA